MKYPSNIDITSREYIFWAKVTPEELDKFQHQPGEGQGIGWHTLPEIEKLPLHGSMRIFMEPNKKNVLARHLAAGTLPTAEELGLST